MAPHLLKNKALVDIIYEKSFYGIDVPTDTFIANKAVIAKDIPFFIAKSYLDNVLKEWHDKSDETDSIEDDEDITYYLHVGSGKTYEHIYTIVKKMTYNIESGQVWKSNSGLWSGTVTILFCFQANHWGSITEYALIQYGGDWVYPTIEPVEYLENKFLPLINASLVL